MAIWLAFEDENCVEHHMKWEGHDTVESANIELDYIFHSIIQGGEKFPNTYIYDSEEPLYGYKEEAFDLGAFESIFSDLNRME